MKREGRKIKGIRGNEERKMGVIACIGEGKARKDGRKGREGKGSVVIGKGEKG